MLDVALLMANASQLKAMLEQGPSASFYTPIVALIGISLFLQVAVGILLVFTGEEIKAQQSLCKLEQRRVSPLIGPFFIYFFRSVHLTPQHESIMTSRLNINKQSNQTCWSLAESLHHRAEMGSEFAWLLSSRECSERGVLFLFLRDASIEGMFESVD